MIKDEDDFILIIPARYNSSRLPGKLLLDLDGEKVLEKVINRCLKVVKNSQIIVATDDKRIANFCNKININNLMTSKNCKTGTDRVSEVASKIKRKFYVNVQGDEIFINPNSIIKVIKYMKTNKGIDVVNCYTEIMDKKEYFDPSIIKVIFDLNNELIYMSRSAIPGNKNQKIKKAHKQVCVYGFARSALRLFGKQKKKSKLEKIEDIEILRFLENKISIKMIKTTGSQISIDTKKDYIAARRILNY
jgi:3-deoxy-manno-octulosonate cytidylyltransferase (CMP-KDO synthetase)